MISRINIANKISLLQLLLFVAVTSIRTVTIAIGQQHQQNDQIYNFEDNQQEQLFANGQQQVHHDSIPGHYKFELAPKMEPPTVRKPPYQQSGQVCPGLEPFAEYSPKYTLCGDLNQGKLPLNPIGQSFSDQSYPFELIKNKTLQFLARALPVLKLEYETIPKVARYLPTNQLLNPTHQASPLTSDQFNQLNHRFASANGFLPDTFLQDAPYLRKRRRKRSIKSNRSSSSSSSSPSNNGMPTVAEMSPNATLTVLSSAHSAGRIGNTHANFRSSNASDSSAQQISSTGGVESTIVLAGVITKDGYKSIAPSSSLSHTSQQGIVATNRQQQPQSAATQRAANYYSWAPSIALAQSSNSGSYVNKHFSEAAPLSSSWINVAAATTTTAASADNANSTTASANNKSQKLVQTLHSGNNGGRSGAVSSNAGDNGQQHTNGQPSSSSSSAQQVSAVNAINSQSSSSSPIQHSTGTTINQNHATSGAGKESRAEQHNSDNAFDSFVGQARSNGNAILTQTSTSTSSPTPSSNFADKNPKAAVSKRHEAYSKGSRLGCTDSANGFTTVICQLASALIEGERQPTWFQVAKGLSNMVSSASSPDNTITMPSNIWSLLSSLTQEPSAAKSNNGASSSNNNLNSNGPLTRSNIMNVLGPIASFISGTSAKDSSSTVNSHGDPQNKEHPNQQTSLLSSSLATTLPKLALAGWASSALANLVEYFVPSIFQSTSRTFAKRKKPFDPLETFVDTPASLAMSSVGVGKQSTTTSQQQQSANLVGASFGAGKQPPTPCPSVEEYISPTFARNYQGAWKYVVQIPHEGYFTQTIQKTSCVNKKCEFTDGVCHESPRWVSLLVAEIYYPNTIFSPQAGVIGDHGNNGNQISNHMATSSSTSNIQQMTNSDQQHHLHPKSAHDPLQMTDSLNSYNHNLNNAFISAANELGWDPNNVNNMQHLANAYNYQLMQRNGLTPGNAQPVVEARSSQTSNIATQASSPAASISSAFGQTFVNQPIAQQQQQQQLYLQQQQQPQQYHNTLLSNQQMAQTYSNDYIVALATAALQQNPNLNINDIINSLQFTQKRKKRDVSSSVQRSTRNQFNNQMNSDIHRPSPLESLTSINDINSQPLATQQTSSINQYKPTQPPISSHQQKSSMVESNIGNHVPVGTQSNQIDTSTNQLPTTTNSADNNGNNNSGNQVECDGHDKIGCYVVRVYYDWFLVNGSCKCWKTSTGSQQIGTQTSSGNSFLRRIFTG